MGVMGMVSLIKSAEARNYYDDLLLKDTNLVIEATKTIEWVKYYDEQRDDPNKYGGNMVEFGQYWLGFFKCLAECRVTPIVVFEGTHLEEPTYSKVASKYNFLINSCDGRLQMMIRYGEKLNYKILPDLALNVFKSLVEEAKVSQVEQSYYESYPLLVKLANNLGCPVLSSHSDLLLSNINRGFIWSDVFNYKKVKNGVNGIPTRLYMHNKFLSHHQIRDSEIVTALYGLLRKDFKDAHSGPLGRLFGPDNRRGRGYLNKALIKLKNKNMRQLLDDMEEVGRDDSSFLDDFNAIHMSYTKVIDYQDKLPAPYNQANNPILLLLKQGKVNGQFSLDLIHKQTHLNRCPLEDTKTKRSTFSMQDTTRAQLLHSLNPGTEINEIQVYDRSEGSMRFRNLSDLTCYKPTTTTTSQLDSIGSDAQEVGESKLIIYNRFSIQLQDRVRLLGIFKDIFKEPLAQQVTNVMLLIRFTLMEACREDPEFQKDYYSIFTHFLSAVYNSIVYYCNNNGDLDETLQGLVRGERHDKDEPIVGLIRVLTNHINEKSLYSCNGFSSFNIKFKHLIELLNSALLAYDELNRILGSPCPKLELHKYYNGVLIHRLASNSSKQDKSKSALLDISRWEDLVVP